MWGLVKRTGKQEQELRVEIGKFQSSPLQFTPGQAKIPKEHSHMSDF